MMNQLFATSHLFGGNAPFVEELYENYLVRLTTLIYELNKSMAAFHK